MKEIERYKITSANGNSSNVTKCDDGHWVNYADIVDFIGGTYKTIHNLEKDNYELKDNLKCVEEGNIKLQARIKELESAERTLLHLGYENQGGELWKPPIGKKPDFNLIDSLNERIKELESQSHINEIKAQGIKEAIKKADNETYIGIVGQEFPPQSQYKAELLCYAEQLRTKHD